MITVSYILNGSHTIKDFNNQLEFEYFCDEVNPFDNPYKMEILEINEH